MGIDFFKLEGKYLKAFCGLGIFSFVYILPILISNFYYIDDLGRSLYGYTEWNGNGRPLASFLAILMNGGMPLMDISPWNQILAAVVLNYSLIVFLRKFAPLAEVSQLIFIACFAYMNLFLLENFSYKYDALGMLLSLGVFLLLYSIPQGHSGNKEILASCIAVIISLSIYQSTIGAYISLAVLEMLHSLHEKMHWGDIANRIGVRIIGFVSGVAIYKFVIANIYVSDWGYSAEHAKLLDFFETGSICSFWGNILAFVELYEVYGTTIGVFGMLLLVVFCFGVMGTGYCICRNRNDMKVLKRLSFIFILLSPFFLMTTPIVFLSVLKVPVFEPRVMISFTIFTLFVGMVIYRLGKEGTPLMSRLSLAAGIIAIVHTLSFSSYYGNLLERQERVNSLVSTFIVYDINELESRTGHRIDKVSFIGHSPKCHELLLAGIKRPLYDKLVPIYMNNDWSWGDTYLSHHRRHRMEIKSESCDRSFVADNPAIRQNEFYRMYLCEDKVIIEFYDDWILLNEFS